MIFVTVGSQKFPFERLIREIDRLVEKRVITEEVFVQIGVSSYEPQYCKWKRFLDKVDFDRKIEECELLITHAGEGAIMSGLLRGKRVIAVPRYAKYGEHVSDHQLEIARALEKTNHIVNIEDICKLEFAILNIDKITLEKYVSDKEEIINAICTFIG